MDHIVKEPEKLFDLCDQDRKGYLIPRDLQTVCPQLDDEEINFIFTTLDSDGSGRIDREEFLSGFQNALCQGENHGYQGIKRRASVVEINRKAVGVPLASDMVYECLAESNEPMVLINKSINRTQEETCRSISGANSVVDFNLPCQDEILQLYEQLQSTGMPKVLGRFEKIVISFCKEIQEQRDQNVQLQHIFESEREAYNRRMNEVENEIDQHITEIQQRAREEERRKLTHEKEEMRSRLEGEVNELRTNIAKMKLMMKNAETFHSEPKNQVKHKLQDLSQENQALKSKLAETHFELAIIKSELAIVRTDYESKKEEMSNDSKALLENARQTDNLQRQLKLLYDANKKLHDTNDSLRKALDQKTILTPSPAQFLFDSSSAKPKGTLRIHDTSEEDTDSELKLRDKSSLSNDFENGTPITTTEFGESNGPPERIFRVVMCGDAAVGKSSIVTRIIKGTFPGKLHSTFGIDFYVKAINIDGKNIAIQLWDTAGQERFRSLCKSYFRRADAAILVYDCTVERSFLNVRDWIATIKESTMRHIPIMMCANKIDLRNTWFTETVSTEDGEAVAAAMGVLFAECSALNGINVEGTLMNLIRELVATEDVEISETGVIIMSKFSKKNNSCCLRS